MTRDHLLVETHGVHGSLWHPESDAGGHCAVVMTGSGGGDRLANGQARALAAAGVPALGLGYCKVPGRPDELRDVELEYLGAAVALVREQYAARPVALLGASRGSELALLAAAHLRHTAEAVIAVVPSNVCYGSYPPGGAAWTLGGEPLPYATQYLPSPPAEVVIAVERVEGPVLLISAGRDEIWPSGPMASAVATRLAEHGRLAEHLHYPEATHSLSYLAPTEPTNPADDAARADGWPRVLRFLGAWPASRTANSAAENEPPPAEG